MSPQPYGLNPSVDRIAVSIWFGLTRSALYFVGTVKLPLFSGPVPLAMGAPVRSLMAEPVTLGVPLESSTEKIMQSIVRRLNSNSFQAIALKKLIDTDEISIKT